MSGTTPPETPGARHELLDPDRLLGPEGGAHDVLDVEDADDVEAIDDPSAADVSDAEVVDDTTGPFEAATGIAPVAADAASVVGPAHVEVAAVSLSGSEGPALEDVEVEVECPGCGLAVVGSNPRPTASWFCPRCDYPLYLVRTPAAPEPDGATRGARRRLPGTAGRAVTAAGPCWNCGEWNEAGVTTCLRCAATLPKPTPPRVIAEVVPPELEPELVEVEVMYWPPVWIALLGGFSAGGAFVGGLLIALDRL